MRIRTHGSRQLLEVSVGRLQRGGLLRYNGRMWPALLFVMLSSCGPVLLGEEARELDAGNRPSLAGAKSEPPVSVDAAMPSDAGVSPVAVTVHITSLDCGRCFELEAVASGGRPPYAFEWEDGTQNAMRRVCLQGAEVVLSVLARDAAALRSAAQSVRLQGAADADCEPAQLPAEPKPPAKICLMNLSLEGTPAANFGQEQAFDAEPWSTCTNPPETNTPDIGNADVVQTLGPIPDPTEGRTFLALGEGEQVSQALCEEFPGDATVSLEMDLTRLNIGAGIVPETEQVFLEIWGGLSVNCSRLEWLWLSPALEPKWERYCITLRPKQYLTQITLRARADQTLSTPAYLAVDNLKVVDACP